MLKDSKAVSKMRPWLIEQREKLLEAEMRRKSLYHKLDKVKGLDEYTNICCQLSTLDLKIEAMKARLKGNWGMSQTEFFKLSAK
ncbi:MAG: hypothetical protein K0B15_07300 [Lentimicrobium sp.]|nr:hypothetical protein [Lentimicrobium sp.]